MIYDQSKKTAYVGHFGSAEVYRKDVLSLIRKAKEAANMDDLHVWLGGGYKEKCIRAFVQESRDYAIFLLKENGFTEEHITVKWNNVGDIAVSMQINTNTGKVRYELCDIMNSGSDNEYIYF